MPDGLLELTRGIVYFVQPVVVTPLLLLGNRDLAGMLVFGPRSFMLSLNGLAYGLMSASAFLAAFAFPGRAEGFVRGAMWAHGAMGRIVFAAIFWPTVTYAGALWIVTFLAMALVLVAVFRRAEETGMGSGRPRPASVR